MLVKIRHEDESESERVVGNVDPCEVESLLEDLRRGGGVYYNGETVKDMSYQFVMNETEIFAEIILHNEEP